MIKYLDWAVRTLASAILIWGIIQQFAGSKESVEMFQQLGFDPLGRFGTSVIEIVVVVLLMTPRMAWLGAICGMVIMGVAIISHLLVLGINMMFALAVTVFVCCLAAYFIRRGDVTFVVEG